MSSLNSVVKIPKHLKPWWKLDGSEIMAHLHRKFWGIRIGDEERSTQVKSGESIDVDKEEEIGIRLDKPVVENEAVVVDVSSVCDIVTDNDGKGESEGEDDDDLIPGCRVLDLDLGIDWDDRILEYQRIFIRADYLRIYNFLERYSDSVVALGRGRPPVAVVTGGSGVGKSVWQYYALCRRLGDRKPIIWYHKQTFFLFLEDGVYQMPGDFQQSHFLTSVWTLIDSDESREGPPSIAMTHNTRLFVIYTTSPAKDRWSRMHKTVLNVNIVMNPWTKAEIFEASELICSPVDPTLISDVFDRLGPTARLCLETIETEERLRDYERDLDNALRQITADKLETLINDANSLSMDAVSHKLFLISRKDRDDIHSDRIVSPITDVIKSRLANQLRNVTQAERIRQYKHFDKVPESRKTAGIYFEAAAQHLIQNGITLKLIPMVVLAPDLKRKRREDQSRAPLPQWHSSHISLRNESLEKMRQQALEKGLELVIRPVATLEYSNDGPTSIDPNVFYVPEADNQVALDSFIMLDGVLYIFQFTIGTTHDIKTGLVNFLLGRPGIPPTEKWRFVFIIKPNLTLTCRQPWSLEVRELPTYTAEVYL